MSFILNLQNIRTDQDATDVVAQPSTPSLSLCFSNQSWAFC
ncbi:SapB/AmfS family lanthipeptide [Streptosporangium sp. NPDC023615]